MKKLLFAGVTAVLAGVIAFALVNDSRDDAELPVQQARDVAPEPEAADLVAPEPLVAQEEPVEELPEGWTVDEDGFVWEPLSFDKPQRKNNGDGTWTTKKLARIYNSDGTFRETPITITSTPSMKRLAPKQRTYEGSSIDPKKKPVTSQDGE